LGGFILPIMFGTLMDLTANRSSAFPRICGVVRVSTIWRYWTEVWATELMGSRARAFRLRGWPSPFNQGKS
jgi:nitrate/nitrite transporter NarK